MSWPRLTDWLFHLKIFSFNQPTKMMSIYEAGTASSMQYVCWDQEGIVYIHIRFLLLFFISLPGLGQLLIRYGYIYNSFPASPLSILPSSHLPLCESWLFWFHYQSWIFFLHSSLEGQGHKYLNNRRCGWTEISWWSVCLGCPESLPR